MAGERGKRELRDGVVVFRRAGLSPVVEVRGFGLTGEVGVELLRMLCYGVLRDLQVELKGE